MVKPGALKLPALLQWLLFVKGDHVVVEIDDDDTGRTCTSFLGLVEYADERYIQIKTNHGRYINISKEPVK